MLKRLAFPESTARVIQGVKFAARPDSGKRPRIFGYPVPQNNINPRRKKIIVDIGPFVHYIGIHGQENKNPSARPSFRDSGNRHHPSR